MSAALFITVEGVEGCGKSTQLQLLEDWMRSLGLDPVRTREPGGTPAAEAIRSLLVDPAWADLSPMADLLLINAARVEHLRSVIEPALAAGRTVLCDRYKDATVAYQASGCGLPRPVVNAVHALPGLSRDPHLTLLFQLPVEEALARARQREAETGDGQRFEGRDLAFHRKVHVGYLELAAAHPGRVIPVDATGSPAAVHARVRAVVSARLEARS